MARLVPTEQGNRPITQNVGQGCVKKICMVLAVLMNALVYMYVCMYVCMYRVLYQ